MEEKAFNAAVKLLLATINDKDSRDAIAKAGNEHDISAIGMYLDSLVNFCYTLKQEMHGKDVRS